MRSIGRKNIFLFFWLIVLADLAAVFLNLLQVHMILKPLLMPVLIIAILLNAVSSKARSIIIAGLFFSFLGDVFLLVDHIDPIYFIGGLLCFLITHIFYIWYFLQIEKTSNPFLKKHPYFIIIIALYTGLLLYILSPKLGDLKIPVFVYACILSMMMLCSLYVFNFVKAKPRILFVAGAVSFVISDSLLAINKFHTSLPFAGVLIMLTYCTAQFLIVRGFIKNLA